MDARDIIVRPIITEKSMKQGEENKISFEVAKTATKTTVAAAIKEIYGIKPEQVNIVNVHPKTRRVGKYVGKTSAVKKAIVKLPEGQTIDIFGNAQ